LEVTGCTHQTVGDIVRGSFTLHSDNHTKPVYKKNVQVNNLDVMLYFWDERDGPNFCGWWFGPKVGGDQVWAYHPDKAATTPPNTGWRVPYDGPIDSSFVIAPHNGGSKRPADGHDPSRRTEQRTSEPAPSPQGPPQGAPPQGPPQAPGYGHPLGPLMAPPMGAPYMGGMPMMHPGYGYAPNGYGPMMGAPPMPGTMPGYGPAPQHPHDQRRRSDDDRRRREDRDDRRRDDPKKNNDSKRIEENKRKLEEQNKKRNEEQKKAQEELKAKHETDEKQKREQQTKLREEQRAMLAVRRIIQKVRLADYNTFDELKKELEEVLLKELENCGTQMQRIKEESDKGLEQASSRMQQCLEEKKKEDERKAIEDKLRAEQEQKVKELVSGLSDLVDIADAKARTLKATAAPLLSGDLRLDEVEDASKEVETRGLEAQSRTKDCTDYIISKGPELKAIPFPNGMTSVSETKQELARLLHRINECSKLTDATLTGVRGAKTRVIKKAAAKEKTDKVEKLFAKYDKDKDKALNRKECQAFSKGEYQFTLSQDELENIWITYVEEGGKGVTCNDFSYLKAMIALAREKAANIDRIKQRKLSEAVLVGGKSELSAKVGEASKLVDEADRMVMRAEVQVQDLPKLAKVLPVTDMLATADETELAVSRGPASLGSARKFIAPLIEGVDEQLKAFLLKELKDMQLRTGRIDARIARTAILASRFREKGARRAAVELDNLRGEVVRRFRHLQKMKDLSNDDLFKQIGGSDAGGITEKCFVDFFDTCPQPSKAELEEEAKVNAAAVEAQDKEVDDTLKKVEGAEKEVEELEVEDIIEEPKPAPRKVILVEPMELTKDGLLRFYSSLDDESTGILSRDVFQRLVRHCMRVVKETVITDGVGINESKTLRRLEAGEVVEALGRPMKETNVEVPLLRVRAQAVKDGLEGYITVAGNQGSVYLEEGGRCYKVVKETILTDSFDVGGEASIKTTRKLKDTTRKLKKGEILECHQWPKKEPISGLMRLKGKARNGGQIGWATVTGNQGTVFLEAV